MGIERFDHLAKSASDRVSRSRRRSRRSVWLHVGQELLQSRPFHRPAGEAAVIVTVTDQPPALVCLALDVGSHASRWASRELKSCPNPWSVETRV